jgi:hypothetical protein
MIVNKQVRTRSGKQQEQAVWSQRRMKESRMDENIKREAVRLLVEYMMDNEHYCPECGRDVSGGPMKLHKEDCKLVTTIKALGSEEEIAKLLG